MSLPHKTLMKSSLLLLVILFFVCCKKNTEQKQTIILLDDIIEMEEKNLKESSIEPSCYSQIGLIGDSILVLNDMCNVNEYFFQFYNSSDFKTLLSFGKIGPAPNEFGSIPFLTKTDRVNFFISEPHGVLKEFQWKNNNLTYKDKGLLPGAGARDIVLSADKIYGKNTTEGQGMIFIQDTSTNEISQWINFPTDITLSPLEKEHRQLLGDNYFAVNSSKKRIISGMRHFNRIQVLDLNGEVIQNIQVGKEPIKTKVIDPETNFISEDAPIYINGIASTEKYIYLLYYGKTFNEMDSEEGKAKSMILIIDWEGIHEKTLAIDGKVEAIAASNDDRSVFLALKDNKEGLSRIVKYTVGK